MKVKGRIVRLTSLDLRYPFIAALTLAVLLGCISIVEAYAAVLVPETALLKVPRLMADASNAPSLSSYIPSVLKTGTSATSSDFSDDSFVDLHLLLWSVYPAGARGRIFFGATGDPLRTARGW